MGSVRLWPILCALLVLTACTAPSGETTVPPGAPSPGEQIEDVDDQAILAGIDAVFASAAAPRLEYFADGGSGPSLVLTEGGAAYVADLKAVFAAHTWERAEGDIAAPAAADPPPEGGAYTIRLLGGERYLAVVAGHGGAVQLAGPEGWTDYQTGDYEAFYRALERFCYLRGWEDLRQGLWDNLDGMFSGQTLSLTRPDGTVDQVVWDNVSDQVRALVFERVWVFLPEGPRQLDEAGARLRLSAGKYAEVEVYAAGGYLRVPGYFYKSVDESGEPDSIYEALLDW